MVRTASGRPEGTPGSFPAGRAGRRGPAGPVPRGLRGLRDGRGARQRAAVFIRRHHLTPYLLLLPSAAAIGLLLLWPTIQIAEFSFQEYGLPQVTVVALTKRVARAYTRVPFAELVR